MLRGLNNRKTNGQRGESRGPLCDPQGLLFSPCTVCWHFRAHTDCLRTRCSPRTRDFAWLVGGDPQGNATGNRWAPKHCHGVRRCRNSYGQLFAVYFTLSNCFSFHPNHVRITDSSLKNPAQVDQHWRVYGARITHCQPVERLHTGLWHTICLGIITLYNKIIQRRQYPWK